MRPRPHRIILLLVAIALVAVSCGSSPEVVVFETPEPTEAPVVEAPQARVATNDTDQIRDADVKAATFDIREEGCDLELPEGIEAECKWFHVPYAHWDTNSPDLHLSMTLLLSPNPNKAADPLVYLSGGPGYPGGDAEQWATSPLLEERDIIVFDQRGTGLSEIDMECAEIEDRVVETLTIDDPFETERTRMGEAVQECFDAMRAKGAYLNGFDTTASAHDLEALRLGLGIRQWNLLGVSYGSRLALESMRIHPEGIRSVILDSVYPTTVTEPSQLGTNADRAIQALSDACTADAECSVDHPDLWSEIVALVDQYNETPALVSVDINGTNVQLTVTGNDLYAGLFNAMYDTQLIPQIPGFVSALADGNTDLAGPIAQQGIEFVTSVSEAMAISTECSDQPSDVDTTPLANVLADPGRHATLLLFAPATSCEWWEVGGSWEGFNEAVTSDIPTLVTAGTLDPITPPAWSQAAADTLTNSTYVEFGEVGHGAVFASDCAMDLTKALLANPERALDTSCVSANGPAFS